MFQPKRLFLKRNSNLNVPFCSKSSRENDRSNETASILLKPFQIQKGIHPTIELLAAKRFGIQGRPQLRLQKAYQFQVPKTNPKLGPCTCLSWSWQSFPVCSVDERGPVFPKPAIKALRGSAKPGRGTPRTQNVLAQGQSEAYGDSKLYNTIVEVPARLNLK